MPIDPIILIYILGGIVLLLLVWIIRLEIKLHRLLKGESGKSLEAVIVATKKNQETLLQWRKEVETYLEKVEKRLSQSIRGIATVRFNPFKGSGEGGNQSFATSFINEKGDGVVVSSLYARERMSVFAKPVKKYASEFELTDEEKQAIEKAKETISLKQR